MGTKVLSNSTLNLNKVKSILESDAFVMLGNKPYLCLEEDYKSTDTVPFTNEETDIKNTSVPRYTNISYVVDTNAFNVALNGTLECAEPELASF